MSPLAESIAASFGEAPIPFGQETANPFRRVLFHRQSVHLTLPGPDVFGDEAASVKRLSTPADFLSCGTADMTEVDGSIASPCPRRTTRTPIATTIHRLRHPFRESGIRNGIPLRKKKLPTPQPAPSSRIDRPSIVGRIMHASLEKATFSHRYKVCLGTVEGCQVLTC